MAIDQLLVKEIFLEAAELRGSAARAACLDKACRGDGGLRARVEALLCSHDQDGSFLETFAAGGAALAVTETFDGEPWRNGDQDETLAGCVEKSVLCGKIGRYEILGVIGWGGMGVVYRARDPRLDRVVAMKVLAPGLAAESAARQRFLREAQTAARVSNDHVVTIHDVGEDGNRPYLVMECIDGVSLDKKIKEGPYKLKHILRIGWQIAEGLTAIHRHNLIHRDIKPSNILVVNESRQVKITDFGLARAVDESSLTQPGTILGTPAYMSPEQATGKEHIDHRTDLFSLGSVLYRMCTGRHPFQDNSPIVVMSKVSGDSPIPILELNPKIPDWLIRIVDRLHQKNPDGRFQSAQEVSELLYQYFLQLPSPKGRYEPIIRPPVPNPPEPPRPTNEADTTIEVSAPVDELSQFLTWLRRIHPGRFDNPVGQISTQQGPRAIDRIARGLVNDKILTPYQAAALCQGKGKELFVGPYVVQDRIGAGAMASVFKAVHLEQKKVVALKVLHPSFLRTKRGVVEQLRREAEALARLKHPNIVNCLEPVRKVDQVHCLVLEYVEGRDLKYLVETKGVLRSVQAMECLIQTAKGLQSAHTLKIIHRDIKPANLMLESSTSRVRILDFGLARVMPLDPWLLEVEDSVEALAIMGTLPYMSPEQATDPDSADARSDIYSLGCTLYFLMTGRPPYTGRTRLEILEAHRQAPIPSLKAVRPWVPEYLDELFRRMLAKDPADRPQTMAAVIANLEMARAECRARPESSQTIPVLPSSESQTDPCFEPSIMEIEEIHSTGRRIRPPRRWGPTIRLARHLLLTGALLVVFIILFQVFVMGWGEADPLPVETADENVTYVGTEVPSGTSENVTEDNR